MTTRAPSLGCIRETWGHMSSVSGFDALCASLQQQHPDRVASVELPRDEGPPGFAKRLGATVLRLIGRAQTTPRAPSPFVEPRHEKAGMNAIRFLQQNPGSLALLSAGENQYSATLHHAPVEIQRRLVVCFHQPPSWHRLHWRCPDAYSKIGAIITLCAEQTAFFLEQTARPVLEMKHGVDLSHFSPAARPAEDKATRLLFVGQWLRDFDTLARSMELIWQWRPDITIDCVVPRAARGHDALLRLSRDPRARWHCDLRPEELSALYQKATLLFLPVLDATANNAVIEALASGLPMVSSQVGGLSHYLPASCGLLARPHSATSHFEAVKTMLGSPGMMEAARRDCRDYAERNLNWQKIGQALWSDLKPVWPLESQTPAQPAREAPVLATARPV